MKLTEENMDFPDCGDPGRETGVRPSPQMEARIAKVQAERAQAERDLAKHLAGKSERPPGE